jgi:hypothetical protein
LAAGARLRGTVALELAPGRRGSLDNSEADRCRPTRAVQVDSDSSSKRRPTAFGATGRLGLPSTWLHRRVTLIGPRSALCWMETQSPAPSIGGRGDDTAGNWTQTLRATGPRTLGCAGAPCTGPASRPSPCHAMEAGRRLTLDTRAPSRHSRAAQNPAVRAPLPRWRTPP